MFQGHGVRRWALFPTSQALSQCFFYRMLRTSPASSQMEAHVTFAPLCCVAHFWRQFRPICISHDSPNLCAAGATLMARECHACDVTSAGWERGFSVKKGAWAFVCIFSSFRSVHWRNTLRTQPSLHHICPMLICLQYPNLVKGPLMLGVYHPCHEQCVAKNICMLWNMPHSRCT